MNCLLNNSKLHRTPGKNKYRVAALFPEQFQRFTDALKKRIFIDYFAQNHLRYMPKGKQKQIRDIAAKIINRKLREP